MIKKEYIQPEVKAVELKFNQILAGSGDNPNFDPNQDPDEFIDEDEVG